MTLRRDRIAPSNTAVNRAGDLLRDLVAQGAIDDRAGLGAAVDTMLAFRASFQEPLTKVVMSMRSFMSTEGLDVIVAQRLKRAPTIIDKLGACRA